MDAPDPATTPPPRSPGMVPVAVAIVGVLTLGACLIGATRTKIRSDAEDAVIREWDSTARELCARLADAPAGQAAPLAGRVLPIRIDEGAQGGRVDFNVFLALPEDWRPTKESPLSQVVILRYRNAELRHYGQSARGGDRIRYRQACTLQLYDLGRQELIAERELLCPDALPEGYGESARLSVSPELVVAELRYLADLVR